MAQPTTRSSLPDFMKLWNYQDPAATEKQFRDLLSLARSSNDRGYRGRVALYEVMPFWDGLKELVINGASAAELKQEAIRLGMQTLRMAGLGKMIAGVTTLEEVVANTAPDRF